MSQMAVLESVNCRYVYVKFTSDKFFSLEQACVKQNKGTIFFMIIKKKQLTKMVQHLTQKMYNKHTSSY